MEKEPQRQSQVDDQLMYLEASSKMLHEGIDRLFDRLAGVLRPPELSPAAEEVETELVHLAKRIKGYGDSVKSAAYRVEDILNRLEL